LKEIIHDSVEETLDDFLEDILALTSADYLNSIAQARADYRQGRTKTFAEVFDV